MQEMQEMQVRSLGQEDSSGEGNGNLFQYSCWKNSMYRGALQAAVHRDTELGLTEVTEHTGKCVCVLYTESYIQLTKT